MSASTAAADAAAAGALALAPLFLRVAETTSRTPARPTFHACSRFSRSSHCSRSNARAVARFTCSVCAVCESLPETRPARITGGRGWDQSSSFCEEAEGRRTVDDPGLDLLWLYLECGGDRGVGDVAADVLERERRECEQADLALELRVVQLCQSRQPSGVIFYKVESNRQYAPYLAIASEWLSAHALYCARPSFKKIWSKEKSSWSFAATTASRRKRESKSKNEGRRKAAATASIAAFCADDGGSERMYASWYSNEVVLYAI